MHRPVCTHIFVISCPFQSIVGFHAATLARKLLRNTAAINQALWILIRTFATMSDLETLTQSQFAEVAPYLLAASILSMDHDIPFSDALKLAVANHVSPNGKAPQPSLC